MAELPLDVVRLVLRRLALRPRLLVAARVCRRWRAAAYASVDAIVHPYAYAGPLDRYPHIAEICVASASAPLPWTPEQCARITSLDLRFVTLETVGGAAFPALTSVSGLVVSRGDSRSALQFLRINSNISHLHLHSSIAAPPEPSPLPLLRSLAIDSVFSWLDLSEWTHTLAQVTHISLRCTELLGRLPPAPALQRLVITALRGDVAAQWAASLTSLTELGLSCGLSADCATLLPRLLPMLTHLSLEKPWLDPASANTLTQASKLCNLRLRSASLLSEWPVLASRLHTLTLVAQPSRPHSAVVTLHATALTTLALQKITDPGLLQRWRLPHLRQLTCRHMSVDFVTLALRLYPSLTHLTLHISRKEPYDVASLDAALMEADARGMEQVEVVGSYEKDLAKLCGKYRWLTLCMHPDVRLMDPFSI